MNPERINRRFHLKEASHRLINPAKNVVEEAMSRLKDGVFDSFGRRHVALFNEETNRIYLVSKTPGRQNLLHRDCGLFVEGIQLNNKRMPEKGLCSIQLPSNSDFVTQSSLFLLRGIMPKEMRDLAKDIGLAKTVGLHIYDLYLTLLRKPSAYRT